jgi:hypothetical protein
MTASSALVNGCYLVRWRRRRRGRPVLLLTGDVSDCGRVTTENNFGKVSFLFGIAMASTKYS